MPKKNIEKTAETVETVESTEDQQENAAVDNEAQEREDAVRVAFTEAVSEELDEDDVKMAMIQTGGATFKNVTRLYNQFMIDAGLAISKADRDEVVETTLSGAELDTEEGFASCVEALMANVQGATERSAAALVRSYAKKNELEVYAKPKGAGTPRNSFASGFYAFLSGNPAVTKEEATAYVNGEGVHADTSDNTKKHLGHYLGIWGLVNKIYTDSQ